MERLHSLDQFVERHLEAERPLGPTAQVGEDEAALVPEMEERRHHASCNVLALGSGDREDIVVVVAGDEGCEAEERVRQRRADKVRVDQLSRLLHR